MMQAVEIDGNKVYQTPIGLLPAVNTILDATTPPEERLKQYRALPQGGVA